MGSNHDDEETTRSPADGERSGLCAVTTLLQDSPRSSILQGECAAHIEKVAPTQTNFLLITYAQTHAVTNVISRWKTNFEGAPANVGIITINDTTRSEATQPSQSPDSAVITTVSDPTNLAGLGATITTYLDAWGEDPNQITICYNSITTLLQHVGLETAFRFFHTVTNQLATHGVHAHFHIDPKAHRSYTLSVLSQLFDHTVEQNASSTHTAARESLSPDDRYSILQASTRRHALQVLFHVSTPIHLNELAYKVAHLEAVAATCSDALVEQMQIRLYHNHLPLLKEHGLITEYGNWTSIDLLEKAHELRGDVLETSDDVSPSENTDPGNNSPDTYEQDR